jgi:hypothetical protein
MDAEEYRKAIIRSGWDPLADAARATKIIRSAGQDGIGRSALYVQHKIYGLTVDAVIERGDAVEFVVGVEHRVRATSEG